MNVYRAYEGHRSRGEGNRESGFTLVEVMMAMLVMAIVVFALTMVLVNSLTDISYNAQRNEAINIANQTIEEVRALGWTTIQQGTLSSDPTLTSKQDPNLYISSSTYCFEGQPLDVSGAIGAQSNCQAVAYADPACLTSTGASAMPTASALASPQPLSPHQQCFQVGGKTYGVDVYLTGGSTNNPTGGAAAPAAAPLTLTVVVSWARPIRGGLSDHIVTTTELSSCLTVGKNCT